MAGRPIDCSMPTVYQLFMCQVIAAMNGRSYPKLIEGIVDVMMGGGVKFSHQRFVDGPDFVFLSKMSKKELYLTGQTTVPNSGIYCTQPAI